ATFSLAARFTRGSGTSGRVDRLMTSRRRTSCATLLVFTCAGRRRCAESLTLRCSLAPLWRNLPGSPCSGLGCSPNLRVGGRACCGCGDAPCNPEGDSAPAAPVCPPAPPGSGDRSPGLPRPLPRSKGAGETPSRGPEGGLVIPGRGRPPGLPPSNGAGDTRSAPASGIAVAPGRGRTPGFPFPRSNGDPPNEGAAVAPG